MLCDPDNLTFSRLSLLDSSIVHTKKPSDQAVPISRVAMKCRVTNTRFRMANAENCRIVCCKFKLIDSLAATV